ncbi:hypothetical protein BXO88_10990 [Oribacterium sp. C9]|nr:hypothetical protein BXO88_10990 [Oribacterium sp. C9]
MDMVGWIKDFIEKFGEFTLPCEYNIKNQDLIYVSVTIHKREEYLTYSVEVNAKVGDPMIVKSAPPKLRAYINENIEQLLDEAIVLIYHGFNTNTYVVEDSDGIFIAEISDLYEKLLVSGLEHDYTQIYNRTISGLPGPKRYCNSNVFFTRMAKKEKRYSLKDSMNYLKLNRYEFALKERSKEEISDPIISVSTPDITRKFGNDNKETFDFVVVELLLRHDLGIQDMDAYVKENLQMLNKRALDKIAVNKKYQSFDVPVEYLKLYSIGTHMKTGVRMMYELKNVSI